MIWKCLKSSKMLTVSQILKNLFMIGRAQNCLKWPIFCFNTFLDIFWKNIERHYEPKINQNLKIFNPTFEECFYFIYLLVHTGTLPVLQGFIVVPVHAWFSYFTWKLFLLGQDPCEIKAGPLLVAVLRGWTTMSGCWTLTLVC